MQLVLIACFLAAIVFTIRSRQPGSSRREARWAIIAAAGGLIVLSLILVASLAFGTAELLLIAPLGVVLVIAIGRFVKAPTGRPSVAEGCLTCGAPLQPDDAFCGQCGAGVPAEQRAGTTEPAPALDVGEALAMGASAIWRLLGIAAVLGSIGWYFYAQQASEKQKCDAYHVQHQLTGERPGFPDIVTCFLNGRL